MGQGCPLVASVCKYTPHTDGAGKGDAFMAHTDLAVVMVTVVRWHPGQTPPDPAPPPPPHTQNQATHRAALSWGGGAGVRAGGAAGRGRSSLPNP